MKKVINIYFVVIYLLPAILYIPRYIYSSGFWFVLFNMIAFLIGLNINFSKTNSNTTFISKINIKNNNYFLYSFIFFLLTYEKLYKVFISLWDGTYLIKGLENAIDRYQNAVESSFTDQLATIIFFIYSFSIGTINYKKNGKKNIFILSIYVIMIIYLSSGLARAGVFMGIIALLSVLIFNARFQLGKISFVSLLKIFSIIFSIFFIVFFVSAYGRLQNEQDVLQLLIFKLGEYSLAMYEALFFWVEKFDFTTITFGRNTFTVVYKIFGFIPAQGFYEDVVITSYGETVIYTIFRGVIEDFSILSIIFFFVISLSISFYSNKNTVSKVSLIVILFSLNFILFPFISIFSVSTFFIAMIIFVFISRIRLHENS